MSKTFVHFDFDTFSKRLQISEPILVVIVTDPLIPLSCNHINRTELNKIKIQSLM